MSESFTFYIDGVPVEATRQISKEFEFHQWADRQHVSAADKEKLLEMMRDIPEALEPLLQALRPHADQAADGGRDQRLAGDRGHVQRVAAGSGGTAAHQGRIGRGDHQHVRQVVARQIRAGVKPARMVER